MKKPYLITTTVKPSEDHRDGSIYNMENDICLIGGCYDHQLGLMVNKKGKLQTILKLEPGKYIIAAQSDAEGDRITHYIEKYTDKLTFKSQCCIEMTNMLGYAQGCDFIWVGHGTNGTLKYMKLFSLVEVK